MISCAVEANLSRHSSPMTTTVPPCFHCPCPPVLQHLQLVDTTMGTSMQRLLDLAQQTLHGTEQQKKESVAAIRGMGLDFTLPGAEDVPLIDGGDTRRCVLHAALCWMPIGWGAGGGGGGLAAGREAGHSVMSVSPQRPCPRTAMPRQPFFSLKGKCLELPRATLTCSTW